MSSDIQALFHQMFQEVDAAIARALRRYKPKLDQAEGILSMSSGGTGTGDGTAKPKGSAGGDLGGSYPDPDVVAIQGHDVSETGPTDGQVLVWDSAGSVWTPTDQTEGPPGPEGPVGPAGPPGSGGPTPTGTGQFLVSLDSVTWSPVWLVTDSAAGLLFDDYGAIIVSA